MITYMITIIPINFIEPLLKSPITILVGGFNPSEKYESQLGVLFPILYIYIWKNAIHVPKHQPVMVILPGMMIKPLEWLSYGYKKCSKPPTSIGFYRYGSIAIWENTPLSDFKLPSHRI